MGPSEFRANAAGYLDSASTLIRTVTETLRTGQSTLDERGRPKTDTPQAVYDVLAEADERLQRVAAWFLDPANKKFD